MSQLLIGDVVSRIRGVIKQETPDGFITDKFIYSVFKKYADLAMKRLDEKSRLLGFSSVFETLDYVELEEVDKVEAACTGIKSYATFKRTVLPMPMFREGAYGPMVRSITSLDGATSITMTTLDTWNQISRSKNFKYNKEKYAWFLNDRLYFPNINWKAVRVEGIFEDDISAFKCDDADRCKIRQEQSLNVPDFVVAQIEEQVLREFGIQLQIPADTIHDNINNMR